MERGEIRPTFTLFVETSGSQALGCIEAHIEASPTLVRGWVATPYAELRMPDEHARFWSPRLGIYVEDTAGGAHIHCRLGPKPDVWTLYLALYAALGILVMVGAFVGYSKWTLGEPIGSWVSMAGGGLALLGALYASAFVGQRLSRGNMTELHDQLRAAFEAYGVRSIATEAVPGENAHE